MKFSSRPKIAVIGLGYVGLPLARLFSTAYDTTGYDIDERRVRTLAGGHDSTLEVPDSVLREALDGGLRCTCDIEEIRGCDFYIITVPTPVDEKHNPDLTPLYRASETVGRVIERGNVVVYESTVYPGVTEEECIPVIERTSGLKVNEDFFAGYSPERVNPGDKTHTVDKIKKVVSGSTAEAGRYIESIYSSVITAGTHLAPSIKVAEASKVIENSQRDINIAFINEIAKIFSTLDIDTFDVLEAAATKWNFHSYKPGLVGGHCIGVDPYYLAQCGLKHGFSPEVILAGRQINDSMGSYVADRIVKMMLKKGVGVLNADILILGFTFKENCPDVRNTKVIDIVNHLRQYNTNVFVYDPWIDAQEVAREYGIEIVDDLSGRKFDAAVLTVAHDVFRDMDIRGCLKPVSAVFDVKGVLPRSVVDSRL